jgi:hypothetical protein
MTDPLAVLQRIRQRTPRIVEPEEERCELCTEPISDRHGHLVDLGSRSLMCACRGCYLLFTPGGAGGNRFRAVPERVLALRDVEFSNAQWDALQIPVGIAFFFFNSSLDRMAAFYPGPAGATESELPLDAWADMVGSNPLLEALAPDVEAFLVRSGRDVPQTQCFVVPIDLCYELVGRLRRTWRGFDGGKEARDELDAFFDRLEERAE